MKRDMTVVVGTLLLVSALGGCTWDNRDTGTAAGGVIGGLAGAAVSGGSPIGVGVGAVGGAIIGNQLAK